MNKIFILIFAISIIFLLNSCNLKKENNQEELNLEDQNDLDSLEEERIDEMFETQLEELLLEEDEILIGEMI